MKMATIKFNPVELNKGKTLFKNIEYLKASKDYFEAEKTVMDFTNTGYYNQQYAYKLDKRLREEYKEIDFLDNLASSLPVTKDPYCLSTSPATQEPVEIRNLRFDTYGIIVSVLLKQDPAYKVEKFILQVVEEQLV